MSDRATIVSLLLEWLETYRQIEAATGQLRACLGADPESLVVKAMYDSFERYTELLSAKIGDDFDWLAWFIWENDAGAKGHEAKAGAWECQRPIRTLEDLADIILADVADG